MESPKNHHSPESTTTGPSRGVGKFNRTCPCIPALIFPVRSSKKARRTPVRQTTEYRQEGVLRKRYLARENIQTDTPTAIAILPGSTRDDKLMLPMRYEIPPNIKITDPSRLGKVHEALGSHPCEGVIAGRVDAEDRKAETYDSPTIFSNEILPVWSSSRSQKTCRETGSPMASSIAETFTSRMAVRATPTQETSRESDPATQEHGRTLKLTSYLDVLGASSQHEPEPNGTTGLGVNMVVGPVRVALDMLYRLQW